MVWWRRGLQAAVRPVIGSKWFAPTQHHMRPISYGHNNSGDELSKVIIREATDTLDLIDQLLGVLGQGGDGNNDSGYVFFDLDETLITRDTCLIDGLDSTRALMSNLEAKLGATSHTLRTIQREMEKDYYNADARLVDPLLARVIRALKLQGHMVYGLTSNGLNHEHAPKVLQTLATYKIRFSATDVRGELPRTGALVMEHPVCRGVIFIDNEQATKHDKGEVMAEFVRLSLQNHTGWESPVLPVSSKQPSNEVRPGEDVPVEECGSRKQRTTRKCVLVDNTSRKCERAARSFARNAVNSRVPLELHAVHFTEAENLVDSPDAMMQLRRILGRLRDSGDIGHDVAAEDFLSPIASTVASAAAEVAAESKSPEDVAIASRRIIVAAEIGHLNAEEEPQPMETDA